MSDRDPRSDVSRDPADAVVALLADDLDAGFVDLVRMYEKTVYSVALRMGNRHDAEDLAAESFLRAYRALLRYDRERILALRPRAWLLTIVLNTWRNLVRETSRRPRQVPLSEATDQPGTEASIEETVQRAETQRDLGALVGELPTTQRIAVVLRHVVGMPVAEVAATLNCPEGTAKSHISRGLGKLRTLFESRRLDGAGTVPTYHDEPSAPAPRRASDAGQPSQRDDAVPAAPRRQS